MNSPYMAPLSAVFGLILLTVGPAAAEDAHHPQDGSGGVPPATTPQPSLMPMMNMMNMMGQGGMPMMMNMMGQGDMPMQGNMARPAMPMMDMGPHIEGRIAFLRAELGITEEQTPQWDAFAKALHDSAGGMQEVGMAMSQSQSEQPGFLQRAAMQERMLTVRLENLKSVKSAFAALQAVLSDDQKKTAEALLTQPMCFGPMGMM